MQFAKWNLCRVWGTTVHGFDFPRLIRAHLSHFPGVINLSHGKKFQVSWLSPTRWDVPRGSIPLTFRHRGWWTMMTTRLTRHKKFTPFVAGLESQPARQWRWKMGVISGTPPSGMTSRTCHVDTGQGFLLDFQARLRWYREAWLGFLAQWVIWHGILGGKNVFHNFPAFCFCLKNDF